MYHVYTEKNHSEFSRTLITETDDIEVAMEKAKKAIEGKDGYNYIIEKTDGSCEYLTADETGLACCAIEKVKPVQCREFPERWNFPDWQTLCGAFADESI